MLTNRNDLYRADNTVTFTKRELNALSFCSFSPLCSTFVKGRHSKCWLLTFLLSEWCDVTPKWDRDNTAVSTGLWKGISCPSLWPWLWHLEEDGAWRIHKWLSNLLRAEMKPVASLPAKLSWRVSSKSLWFRHKVCYSCLGKLVGIHTLSS